VIFGGLFLTGLANTFTTISTYEEMYDPFMTTYGPLTPENNEKLSDILSGIYNAGFSTGVIIGPLIGSYLTIWLDYGSMNDIMGFFGIAFGLLHLIFVYIPKMMAIRKANKSHSPLNVKE
jgi:MFS family permease